MGVGGFVKDEVRQCEVSLSVAVCMGFDSRALERGRSEAVICILLFIIVNSCCFASILCCNLRCLIFKQRIHHQ